ncbi:RteC domain-containing protein [Aestuariivivens sediminicola]|uniref:RteC domain-containing protein n=1 Tax=Aestuariivivens sediminicola TaxID=2913560 RepID=UPI001F598AA1|nr:RteC domain-containing protein [Aestuariivivens sediminicola]
MELFPKTQKLYSEFRNKQKKINLRLSKLEKGSSELFENTELRELGESYNKLIADSFEKERNILLENKIFFWGCNFNTYKNTYINRLKDFKEEFEDAEEIDFIRSESNELINLHLQVPFFSFIKTKTQKKIGYSITKKQNYLSEIASSLGYELNFSYDDEDGYEFIYLTENINNSKSQSNNQNNIEWLGNQTEFIELIKALIENGTLKGTQKDIIKCTSRFFNIEIKNPDKLLTDIKKRNIGSETLFLDRLKSSLYNYIIKENRR